MWVGRVLWLVFISTCSVVAGSSMFALSVAGAQTTLDKRQPMLMTAYKWASLTEGQRQIYTRGFLETLSYLLYGRSQQNNKEHAKIFSEWTMCAEHQPLSSWQTLGWSLHGRTDETVAAQFYDIAPVVCRGSAGKGDASWRPVWLLKPEEWKALSLNDRAIYLMVYVETVYASMRRAKDSVEVRKLDICIASVGIEGLISSMERTKFEWQFPLPWSASRALGSACKAQGN
jgi:hypothetical protein